MYTHTYNAPFSPLQICEDLGKITGIYFGTPPICGILKESPIILEAKRQLEDYFNHKRQSFDLPLALNGTVFQKQVWAALCAIPYGQTASYGQVAAAIGNPKACRAVGMANNRNPIALVVPCHRVIGSTGKLVGYGGGLHIKQWLLHHEGCQNT